MRSDASRYARLSGPNVLVLVVGAIEGSIRRLTDMLVLHIINIVIFQAMVWFPEHYTPVRAVGLLGTYVVACALLKYLKQTRK
jgi:hypothetical protein